MAVYNPIQYLTQIRAPQPVDYMAPVAPFLNALQVSNEQARISAARNEQMFKEQQILDEQRAQNEAWQASGGDPEKYALNLLAVNPALGSQLLNVINTDEYRMGMLNKQQNEKQRIMLDLGPKFAGIQNESDWEMARQNYGNTGAFIPAWNDPTRQAWVKGEIKPTQPSKAMTKDERQRYIDDAYSYYLQNGKSPQAIVDYQNALPDSVRSQINLPIPYSGNLDAAWTAIGARTKDVAEMPSIEASANLKAAEAESGKGRFNKIPISFNGVEYTVDENINSENREFVAPLRNEYKGIINNLEKSAAGVRESLNAVSRNVDSVDENGKVSGIKAVYAMFRFMKGIDEGGIVRDTDLQMLMDSMGLIERVEGGWFKLKDGVSINKKQLVDMQDYLSNRVANIDNEISERSSEYALDALDSYGVNPAVVIGKKRWDMISGQGGL